MVKVFVIGPCRLCVREGVGRIESTETDLCLLHLADAIERGEECFIAARTVKALLRERDKRQAARRRVGWATEAVDADA